MLDTIAENQPDRRPAILLCVYETADTILSAMDTGETASWSPPGTRVRALGPDDPAALARTISSHLDRADCSAVLLIGRTRKSNGFRIQMRAENRGPIDGKKVSSTGPAMARATAPAAEIVRALTDAGLAADATSDSEEDVGSYLLYSILTALPDNADAPSVGLLRTPASLTEYQLRLGLQTAAAAMARHMSPLPRARLS